MEEAKVGVKIERDAPVTVFPFTEYFKDFEKVAVIRKLFGTRTGEVLDALRVEFFSARWGYMSVSDADGHLLISSHHLKESDFNVVYLDLIHELHHVKQFMDGKKLFLDEYEYPDSPIEIEAYRPTVEEARRIGMTEEEIFEYLKVEWMTPAQHERLARTVGVLRGR